MTPPNGRRSIPGYSRLVVLVGAIGSAVAGPASGARLGAGSRSDRGRLGAGRDPGGAPREAGSGPRGGRPRSFRRATPRRRRPRSRPRSPRSAGRSTGSPSPSRRRRRVGGDRPAHTNVPRPGRDRPRSRTSYRKAMTAAGWTEEKPPRRTPSPTSTGPSSSPRPGSWSPSCSRRRRSRSRSPGEPRQRGRPAAAGRPSQGAHPRDRSSTCTFTTAAKPEAVVEFCRKELPALGWRETPVIAHRSSPRATASPCGSSRTPWSARSASPGQGPGGRLSRLPHQSASALDPADVAATSRRRSPSPPPPRRDPATCSTCGSCRGSGSWRSRSTPACGPSTRPRPPWTRPSPSTARR